MNFPRILVCSILCASASLAIAGQPVPLTGIFNTGVDNTGVSLPEDSVDPHYTFATPPPTGTVPIVNTSATGFPIAPGGPWLGDSPISAWICPAPDTTGNAGDYFYRTTFTISAGVDLSQVFVTGRLTSDNATSGVLINGVATGITGSGNFPAFDPQFMIQTGFVAGLNTIDFVVNEATGSAGANGFTGLRVEMNGSAGPAGHVAIPGLANTGVSAPEGTPLADDATDSRFTLTGTISGPAVVATAAGGFPIPPWLGNTLDSAWLTPAANTEGPEGDYFYEVSFNLAGLASTTAGIFGRWSVDNGGTDILLNGVSTGNVNNNGFGAWTSFSISPAEGDVFLPGVNTLRFAAFNGPGAGPTGVRVEFLSATAAVPEPSTALLALAGLGVLLRRRRGA